MKIQTKQNHFILEIIINSTDTQIKEDISEGISYKVDPLFKDQIESLIKTIYRFEDISLSELFLKLYKECNSDEQYEIQGVLENNY